MRYISLFSGIEAARILLVNVDCRWNLALRRMYAYYEQRGCEVEMCDLGYGFYPHNKREIIDGRGYDLVAISNIFETNADRVRVVGCQNVIRGGLVQGMTRDYLKR